MNRRLALVLVASTLILNLVPVSASVPTDPRAAIAAASLAAESLRAAVIAEPRLAAWAASLAPAGERIARGVRPVAESPAAIPATAALALAALTALAVRSRAPRRRVLRLARRGVEVAGIARRTGLAQDAVRLLMAPPVPAAGMSRKGLPVTRFPGLRRRRPGFEVTA